MLQGLYKAPRLYLYLGLPEFYAVCLRTLQTEYIKLFNLSLLDLTLFQNSPASYQLNFTRLLRKSVLLTTHPRDLTTTQGCHPALDYYLLPYQYNKP
jgi:hypothetical protein